MPSLILEMMRKVGENVTRPEQSEVRGGGTENVCSCRAILAIGLIIEHAENGL